MQIISFLLKSYQVRNIIPIMWLRKLRFRKVNKFHHNFSFSKLGFDPQSEFYLIISRLSTHENVLFIVLFSHIPVIIHCPLPIVRLIFCFHHYIFKIKVALNSFLYTYIKENPRVRLIDSKFTNTLTFLVNKIFLKVYIHSYSHKHCMVLKTKNRYWSQLTSKLELISRHQSSGRCVKVIKKHSKDSWDTSLN